MSRKCEFTGTGVQFGNNVSHSQRKSRRRFEPNLRTIKYTSEYTKQSYTFLVSMHALRTVEKNGGFDNFITAAKNAKLSEYAKSVKNKILKIKEEKAA